MTKYLIGLYLITLSIVQFGQYYPQQSMYMFQAASLNPAAAGQHEALNFTVSHRAMWRGINGAPTSQFLAINSPLKNEKLAAGIQISHDKIGVSGRTSAAASGAYRLKLGPGKLSFGLSLGLTSVSNKWSEINTTDIGDYVFNSGDQSYALPSAAAGIFYESPKVFAGLSIPQFFTETYAGGNKYKATSKIDNYSYLLMAGKKIDIHDNMQLQVAGLAKYHKGSTAQFDLTTTLSHNKIGELGITVRPKDALVFIARLKVNDQFRLGYSYDHQTSYLARYNKGSHEISLMYTFLFNSNAPNTRFF